ncbi:MAG TPA: GNAT family N-acetyltransferase [Micromonospora sp.]
MPVRSVHDRQELAGLLGRDPALHAYQLGDLDDFFWPYTSWFRHGDAVALLYHGASPPTLLAMDSPANADQLRTLLAGLVELLPRAFYAHLSPGLEPVLTGVYHADPGGRHLKYALTDPGRLDAAPGTPAGTTVTPLTGADLAELEKLYQTAYPGNWFDPRMLETGHYLGVRRGGELLAVAGVHVWSPTWRVAALGNVTTHPRARGEGLATVAVAALCRRLLATVDHVTLNVKADNAAAIAVYTRLGFTPVAEYDEVMFTA